MLCAGAVLAALRGRSTLAGVLLGLAIANKAWALLAVGPVLLALQADRRRALAIAGAIAAAFVAAGAAGQPGGGAHRARPCRPARSSSRGRCGGSSARPGEVIRGADGVVKEGYRAAPGWLSPISATR